MARKRRSGEALDVDSTAEDGSGNAAVTAANDENYHPPQHAATTTAGATDGASDAPPSKLARTALQQQQHQRQLRHTLAALDVECDERIARLDRSLEEQIASLRFHFSRQLTRLPARVRAMPLRSFVGAYSSSVERVSMEAAATAARELQTWVAETPRLLRSARGKTLSRELAALQQGGAPTDLAALHDESHNLLLASAQRLTRASARKALASAAAGAQPQQQLLMVAPMTVTAATRTMARTAAKANAATAAATAAATKVFETPSARGRTQQRMAAGAVASKAEGSSDL